jgi:hypothetical protein
VINGGLPSRWPESVLAAARRFRQGHLVQAPPFFYWATPAHGIWALTATADASADEEVFELETEDRAAYGLITTQTCDINEAKPKHPWIHVAPVEQMAEGDLAAMVRQHRVSYLVPLNPPTLEGFWVADLRLEVPVEKSWLVGCHPVESYSTEADYERLAERLSHKRERPALADALVEGVYQPLTAWLGRRAGREASTGVREIRFRLGGTRLVPTAAGLVLIKDEPWSAAERAVWDRWWDHTHRIAEEHGIALLASEYQTYDSMSARDYVDSVPINLSYLSG